MDDAGPERQLNIQIDPDHLVGVYANFANISFSEYEFTLTFARIDHEAEQGDVPGVVVTRVNMSPKFAKELLDALEDSWSKYATVKGIQDLPGGAAARAVAIRSTSVGCVSRRRWSRSGGSGSLRLVRAKRR